MQAAETTMDRPNTLDEILNELQEQKLWIADELAEAERLAKRWRSRWEQNEVSIAEIRAAKEFGVAVGYRVRLSSGGWTWQDGVIEHIGPGPGSGITVRLRRDDGGLDGYTLNLYSVEIIDRGK